MQVLSAQVAFCIRAHYALPSWTLATLKLLSSLHSSLLAFQYPHPSPNVIYTYIMSVKKQSLERKANSDLEPVMGMTLQPCFHYLNPSIQDLYVPRKDLLLTWEFPKL